MFSNDFYIDNYNTIRQIFNYGQAVEESGQISFRTQPWTERKKELRLISYSES